MTFQKKYEIAKYRLRIGTFVSIFKGSQIVIHPIQQLTVNTTSTGGKAWSLALGISLS